MTRGASDDVSYRPSSLPPKQWLEITLGSRAQPHPQTERNTDDRLARPLRPRIPTFEPMRTVLLSALTREQ